MSIVTDFVDAATKAGGFSFDVENPPELRPHLPKFRLAGCNFGTDGDFNIYLTDTEEVLELCRRLFVLKLDAVAYNAKYDLRVLRALDPLFPYPIQLCDPMIAVNLLDDNRRPNQLGLKKVMLDLFDEEMMDFMTAWRHGEHSTEFREYALNDARQEWRLWKWVKPRLESEKLDNLFRKILMPMTLVFADMETVGCRWNIEHGRRLLRGFQTARRELEAEVKEKIGNLNLGSDKQLAERLFGELGYSAPGLEWLEKSSRFSVDRWAMDKLAKKYPVCEKIRQFRTARKMISTYIEPLTRAAMEDHESRVHPTFWLTSATGRTRCSNPNFQNLPNKLPGRMRDLRIRDGIEAKPGYKLVVFDYSQIELRMCAHVTGDKKFTAAYTHWTCTKCGGDGDEAARILRACPVCGELENERALKGEVGFWHGKDIHTETSQNIAALGGDRQKGKIANFQLIYNITAFELNRRQPEWSKAKWQSVIDEFFSEENYIGVLMWHHRMERLLWETGVVRDVFGRKRRIPRRELERSAKHAMNQFVNFPMQCAACHLIELGLGKLRERLIERGEWMGAVLPTNMVHDEAVLEVREDKVEEVLPIVVDVMENSVQFKVPIRLDVKVVDVWGKAKG